VRLGATIPIQLELGQTNETVAAEARLLESAEATLGQQVSNMSILSLPTNGRNA
jgi:hypothetical protein